LTALQALILGLVQGFTEFLPVSSSGHLVLAQHLFGLKGDLLSFDIFVHFGTLLAVLAVFHRNIISIFLSCLAGLRSILVEKFTFSHVYHNSRDIRMAVAIIVGTIPAGIIGLTLKDPIEALFSTVVPVLAALAVTGAVLLTTFFMRQGEEHVGFRRGLLVGIAQAIAIIPGISRSGSTISAALLLKVDRQTAGEFSFLLSLPAVAGATVLAAKDLSGGLSSISPAVIILGTLASFISGLFSLILLMKIIRMGKIGYFGFYCLAVSAAGFAFMYLK
jgi:undecaprenyl-diphosphatase